jgi:L-xylulokinase
MQMLADLTAMNIEIPNVDETGAFGAALVAMLGAGQYPSIECALKSINVECQYVTPNPDNFVHYQVKYKKYLKIVQLFKEFEEQKDD